MGLFDIAAILSAFLCSLVAGLLFIFAVVVMPGIGRLEDRAYLRAFQVIDGVIQDNQPLFLLVWAGSVLMLVISAILGIGGFFGAELDESGRALLLAATIVYLVGVQLPTVAINIPLNAWLKTLDLEAMDQTAAAEGRARFERRWNRSNVFRTVAACLTSILLIVLLVVI